jgi:hypothetical protein
VGGADIDGIRDVELTLHLGDAVDRNPNAATDSNASVGGDAE